MRRILSLLVVAVVLTGCGQTSFVGTQYDNFTAYYNKFFNARKAFDRGLKSLERRDVRIDRDRYLPLFINPDAAASSSEFQATIKKSADVLREHPNSKWVDDALLLIGKSYFYQRNYVGAEQKFLEVINLRTNLEDEARFWLARTLITGGNYEDAASALTESLNREGVSRRWRPMLQLAMGELNVERGDWTAAAEALSEGLESVRDNDLGARAQFLLGQIYETLGDYERAFDAYRRVERFRPLYELSYAAKLSAVRVQGSYLDEELALRELRRMERDDKHYQYRNELSYIRGRIYQKQGHADDAFLLYDHILYEADGDINSVRGRIHYALGELYRDVYRDFMTASAHFDTASTALSAGAAPRAAGATTARATRFTPEAVADATVQKETFASFADVMTRINEMDSLLYLGSLDDDAFDEAVLTIRRQIAAEMAAQRRELERRQASQAFQDAGAAEAARARTTTTAASSAGSEAGFLYHQDPLLVEEARLSFQAVWGDRPLVPNWRRRAAVNSYLAALSAEDEGGEAALDALQADDDPLPVVDLSSIPRDSLSRVQMRADRAAASYELANVLFLSMNRPDSAAVWYRMVIDDTRDTTLTQRAYYALAEVQQSVGDTAAARVLYENVVAIAPTTNLGRQISRKLGRAPAEEAVRDTLTLATRAYDRAYSRWQIGNYRSALTEMIELAARYPNSDVAPKALMAAGTIYAEWARADSMDILGEVPVSLPDSLLKAIGLHTRKMQLVADTASVPVAVSVPDTSTTGNLSEELTFEDEVLEAEVDSVSQPGLSALAAIVDSTARQREERRVSDDSPLYEPDPASDEVVEDEIPAEVEEVLDEIPAEVEEVVDEIEEIVDADAVADDAHDLSAQDSVSTADAQMAAAVDSILIEVIEPINLDRIYASVETRYSDSPFASRATNIRAALEDRRRERVRQDSMATAIVDSLLRDSQFPDLDFDEEAGGFDGVVADSLVFEGGTEEGVADEAVSGLGGEPGAADSTDVLVPTLMVEPADTVDVPDESEQLQSTMPDSSAVRGESADSVRPAEPDAAPVPRSDARRRDVPIRATDPDTTNAPGD